MHNCVPLFVRMFFLKDWRVMAHCWNPFSALITRQQCKEPRVSFGDYQAPWWGSRCKAVWNWGPLHHPVVRESSCSPTSTEALEQLGNWGTFKVSSYSHQTHLSWPRWGLCLGKHDLWDAAVPRGLFTEFHQSSRPSVVPDHHKGIIWVKEIIKTSEGMVVCF